MNKKRIIRITQLILTVVGLIFTGHAEAKNHHSPDQIIVVGPADLPELARVTGQAMMLHDTMDGRTLLYIEQSHGARLAIFDVTDPAHVKAEGTQSRNASLFVAADVLARHNGRQLHTAADGWIEHPSWDLQVSCF